ncbi:uncharacterized protein LOC107802354 isoform X1 [Nicotiana tabacum]|uniref:Uncharacterized protein LOC107802354 isoform X1 n=2 Tax=Nicotiana tabacum TaxID=4097 RepID=A0AC58U520_TOBAC
MDSKKRDNCLHGEKRKAAMQLKRRDTYNQISPTRRDALLLSRRMRKQDTARHNLAENAIVAISEQASSSLYKAGFPKQTALTIREPHALLEKVASYQLCATTSRDNVEKGKDICNPLVIPEMGHTHAKKICLATREQRDAYVSLKKVANCQYCAAKRFEYEPPTFCCGSGSIRLTAHKMPIELSKLYFENTEESEHFRTYIRMYNNMFAFTSFGVKYDKELAKRNCGIYTFRV